MHPFKFNISNIQRDGQRPSDSHMILGCWLSKFTHHSWVSDWSLCQKMSVCVLGTPGLDPSGLLRKMSVWVGVQPGNPVVGTGPESRSAHCCGWSCGNHDDCVAPGYQWPGTLDHRHSLRHKSPQPQAEEGWARGTLWGRYKGLMGGREGASHPARPPQAWTHTPREPPGCWLER